MNSSRIESDFATATEHHRAGRWVEASQLCRGILSQNSIHPGALNIMGLLARRAGNPELAVEMFRKSSSLESLIQLGDLLTNLQRFEDAETVHRRFIAAYPRSPVGWTNLGNVFRVQGKIDAAMSAYQTAIDIEPNFAAAHSNLGNVLKDLGKIDEAIIAFRRAVELDPTSAEMHSNLVYATSFSAEYDAQQILDEARRWADRHEKPLLGARPSHLKNLILKIGYVSGDFRDHVIGRNVLPILERHDRTQFEIHCFSTLDLHDATTHDYMNAADYWHECAAMDDASLAQHIRDQKIDILVDLTLHMSGNRLKTFACKPAPIQVTWAGYPGTTGLSSIDYRITDPHLDPPGLTDQFYSEKSIRLPHSFWCYRPMDNGPAVNTSPAEKSGLITFGCLNNFGKVSQAALNVWAEILRQTLDSQFVLLCPAGSHRAEITEYFQSAGVESSRIDFVDFAPPQQHLYRYHRIDIALDPMPYTGHTTTLDALWMGVPVVTLSGNTSFSRGSVTALANLGLQDLIALSSQQYISIAISLSKHLPRLILLRQQLRCTMVASSLCDEAEFTSDLETAYRMMIAD